MDVGKQTVKITPQVTYRIEYQGVDKGTFEFVEEWEGMKKYANESAVVIVNDASADVLGRSMMKIFGEDPLEPQDLTIIKASPDFIGQG